jgi:hypothetical protein
MAGFVDRRSTIRITVGSNRRTIARTRNPVAAGWPRSPKQEEPMTTHRVGYLIGSLAKGSINRKLAKALVRLAPPELEMSEISFKDLPLYSYDYDANYPPAGKAFKDAIAAVNAVLFVTLEYNRSIPGGLKNAIDWASRHSMILNHGTR